MATTRATELGQLAKLVTVDSDGNSVISGTFDATLPASGVVAGVHGSASSVPIMSVTAQGLIDSVGSAPIVSTNSFDFDSATGQITIGFSDTTSLSQNITLDPFTTADLTEGSNLYYTDARFDSAFGVKTTADLTEGSNLYYTTARFDSDFGDNSTTNLTEGSNLYYTTARADSDAKAAISVTDAGGDGSLTYSAGTITYTGPSASETRAHFSGGTGVDISSGVVSIGQNVDSSATVIFQTLETTGNIVVGGNLQVNGSTTTVSSQNLQIEDNMFYLNQLESDGSPTIEVDVGFAANVNDTGSYAHTGFFRDATDATWKLFDGYTPEPDSDLDIDINHASFSYADLQVADLTAGAVTSTGLTVNGDLDVSNNNPRIRFDDTDTSNNAEITVDNTQLRIEVDEDNAVGSSQIKFRIDGSDTAVLNSSGRLGIGTSNPGGILHLEASTSRAILKSTGADEASINFNTPSGNTYMGLAGAAGELFAGSAAGDYVVSNRTGGDIHLSADTAFTDAHLSIIETGNVGIGSSSPATKLAVVGDVTTYNASDVDNGHTLKTNTGSDYSQHIFRDNQGSTNKFIIAYGTSHPSTPSDIYIKNNEAAGGIGFNTAAVERMKIESNGNVGIGTNAPGRLLDVGGSGNGEVASFKGGNSNQVNIAHASNSSWGLLLGNSDNTYNTGYHYSPSGQNLSAAIINVNNDALHLGTNNSQVMTINHSGNVSIGVNNTSYGKLDVYQEPASGWTRSITRNAGGSVFTGVYKASGTNSPGVFAHNAALSAWADLWINAHNNGSGGVAGGTSQNIIMAGNVGIGTASPQGLLHISSGTAGDAKLIIEADTDNNNEADGPYIEFRADGGIAESAIGHVNYDLGMTGLDNALVIANSVSAGGVMIRTGSTNGWTNASNYTYFDTSGQVGIGTDSPGFKLDVYGTGNFTGKVDFQGDAAIEGGSGYGVFKGYTNNNNHLMTSRGIISGSTSSPTITGGHNQTFVEYVNDDNSGWFFKTSHTGTYAEKISFRQTYNIFQEDVRAPLFYDKDDTARYVDPTGTTRLHKLENFGGAKLEIQAAADGGSGHGIYMWTDTDTNWVIYMSQSGANKAPDAGTACTALDGRTAHHIRYRVNNNNTQGHLWENSADNCLMSLQGDTGRLYTRAEVYATSFIDRNNSTYFLDPSSTGDSIRCAGDIVAYYSDERLKDREGNIFGAIDKVSKLNGFYYRANKKAQELGYDTKLQVGVSAQEVEAVLPEVVKDAPIGQGYKTVKYDRMVPLLIEAIKEQQEIINKQSQDIDELKQLVKQLMENK